MLEASTTRSWSFSKASLRRRSRLTTLRENGNRSIAAQFQDQSGFLIESFPSEDVQGWMMRSFHLMAKRDTKRRKSGREFDPRIEDLSISSSLEKGVFVAPPWQDLAS
jgi:hypothetical protein